MFIARKRSTKSSGFKKAVTAIAKKTVMAQAETKTASISVSAACGTSGNVVDVWSKIGQGDNQNNRDGDRIKALGIKIRGYVATDPGFVTTNQDNILVRMLVLSGKRPLTTITDMGLTYNGTVDSELLNVHQDSLFTFKLDGRTRVLNKYIKFNRNILYNPNSNTPSKNELYVVFLPFQTVTAGMTTGSGLYLNYIIQPYFKDL